MIRSALAAFAVVLGLMGPVAVATSSPAGAEVTTVRGDHRQHWRNDRDRRRHAELRHDHRRDHWRHDRRHHWRGKHWRDTRRIPAWRTCYDRRTGYRYVCR